MNIFIKHLSQASSGRCTHVQLILTEKPDYKINFKKLKGNGL